jgi:dihydrodipicolinate synthase/N-acetylneuraminate lyase
MAADKKQVLKILKKGQVIPAHPLALDKELKLDEKRQRALTRYYLDAGAGGIAVGVHTTQFEIHQPGTGLYKPVLEIASGTAEEFEKNSGKEIVKIAGICGDTKQAVGEAQLAVNMGYDAGLLSLAAFRQADTAEMIEHAGAVAEIIPLFGFYLQPAVGGRILDFEFWRKFCEIENVIGIKIAPFNRYFTIDVVRALCETGREKNIVLYTGNDDNIVNDLVTTFEFSGKKIRMAGGLLGHWAIWTQKAVELLEGIQSCIEQNNSIPKSILKTGAEITDCNSAVFDARNNFTGCISGINEVLKRAGFLEENRCINPEEKLSPGQSEEINRIYNSYPHLIDDNFVKENIDRWFK